MSERWARVRLERVLCHRKEFITIDDLTLYRRPRVQLHARGIVLRDEVPGSRIKTKKQQVCRLGEFLVAEIDAKMGGFGIVPEALDGAIVSGHYFLFELDAKKLDRAFLDYFIRTRMFRQQVEAQGSTNYAAIRPGHVLQYEMPLPPLSEQRRIVARIEELAVKVEEVRRLKQRAIEQAEALLGSARGSIIGTQPSSDWVPLSAYIAAIESGKSPATEGRPSEFDEWGVLKVGSVSFGYFESRENKALPPSFQPIRELEVHPGDFLMTRANTLGLVGACAVVHETRPRLMLSDKTFRLLFRGEGSAHIEYFDHVLKSPALRVQIMNASTGTSPTMKNISKERVLALRVPRAPLDERRRVVARLDHLQHRISQLKRLQSGTAAELDALLPSILDQAFKGEL